MSHDGGEEPVPVSPDQLAAIPTMPYVPRSQLIKLASLLQQDVITRDEFEHLKARLIAES